MKLNTRKEKVANCLVLSLTKVKSDIDMEIKEALQSDHNDLTTLMRRSKSYWQYDQQQLKNWQTELTISPDFLLNNRVFKLVDKIRIIGFFAFSIQDKNLKLESLFILPKYIGKGIGKYLMNVFLEKVKGLPIETIFLDADPNTEEFYKRFDFRTVSLKSTSIKNRFMPVMVKQMNRPKMVEMAIFETDRLFVRKLRKDDLDDFHNMQGNPNVMRFIKQPMTLEQSRNELARFIKCYDRRNIHFRIWSVIEKASNLFVGICGVYLNEKDEYEIAYRFQEEHWGKGIGSEITKELICYCFTILQYPEIVAYVSKDNFASNKIAKQFMTFDNEFYSAKDKCIEFVYRQQRDSWLQHEAKNNGGFAVN